AGRVLQLRGVRPIGRAVQSRKTALAEFPLYEGATACSARARGTPVYREARISDSRRRRVASENDRDAPRARQNPGRAGGLRVVLFEGSNRDRSESSRQ